MKLENEQENMYMTLPNNPFWFEFAAVSKLLCKLQNATTAAKYHKSSKYKKMSSHLTNPVVKKLHKIQNCELLISTLLSFRFHGCSKVCVYKSEELARFSSENVKKKDEY